jgi:hypothetical protein
VLLTQHKPKTTQTNRRNKMAQRKEAKKIKVRDLTPKKDAKGGMIVGGGGGGSHGIHGVTGGHQVTGPGSHGVTSPGGGHGPDLHI